MTRPTFTLRDLFWLVLVCALGIVWCLEHDQAKRLRALEHATTTLRALESDLAIARANDSLLSPPPSELRRLKARVEAAKQDVENARLETRPP